MTMTPTSSRSRLYAALFAVVLLLLPRQGLGQDGVRGYAGGAFTILPTGPHAVSGSSPSTTYDTTSPDSTTRGLTVELGGTSRRQVSLGVEIGVPFERSLTQTFGYFTPFIKVSHYRDLTFFGVASRELPATGRIHLGLTAGAGLVQQRSRERISFGQFNSTNFGPFGDEQLVSRWTWGATGGADLSVQAARHVTIVPQVRVLFIDRGRMNAEVAGVDVFGFGLDSFGYRFGVGIRGQF